MGFVLSRPLCPAQRSVWAGGVGQGKPYLVAGETEVCFGDQSGQGGPEVWHGVGHWDDPQPC